MKQIYDYLGKALDGNLPTDTIETLPSKKELINLASQMLSESTGLTIELDERLDLPGAYVLTDKTNNKAYFVPKGGIDSVRNDGHLGSLRIYLID